MGEVSWSGSRVAAGGNHDVQIGISGALCPHYQPAPLSPNYDYGENPNPSSGNTSDVLLALLQCFDPSAEWIGEQDPDGAGSGTPLTEILA